MAHRHLVLIYAFVIGAQAAYGLFALNRWRKSRSLKVQ